MDWEVEEGSNQLITVHSAASFVFVGVDSNHFRTWYLQIKTQDLGEEPLSVQCVYNTSLMDCLEVNLDFHSYPLVSQSVH